jgi:hypothetical protein
MTADQTSRHTVHNPRRMGRGIHGVGLVHCLQRLDAE